MLSKLRKIKGRKKRLSRLHLYRKRYSNLPQGKGGKGGETEGPCPTKKKRRRHSLTHPGTERSAQRMCQEGGEKGERGPQ